MVHELEINPNIYVEVREMFGHWEAFSGWEMKALMDKYFAKQLKGCGFL